MNKFEMELNENKAKAFFVRHGEKLGLGAAAGMLGLFAYLGMGLQPDLQGKTPTTLEGTVVSAENYINRGRWEELRPFRMAVSNAVEQLDTNKVQVAASDYAFDYLLARRSASAPPRQDPPVLPVVAPETFVARVSLADTAGRRHPLRNLDAVNLAETAANQAAGPESGDSSGGATRSSAGKQVDMSAALAAPGLDPAKASLGELENAAPVDRYLVTVKYAFPFKKMVQEFRATFKNAIGYDVENDRFLIRHMEIERRTNGGEWENVTTRIREQEKSFVVSSPDPFDEKYFNQVLTRPYPPVLLADYYPVAKHGLIPMAELPEEDATSTGLVGGVTGAGSNRTTSSGGAGGRSAMPGGVGGRSGMPAGAGGRSGMPAGAGGRSGMPAGAGGRSGMPGGAGGRSGMPGGASGRSGMSGMMGQGGMMSMTVVDDLKDAPDYKMVRFTDSDVRPGNEYEYRVRYWIYDPNNPAKMEGFVAKAANLGPTSASAGVSEREDDLLKDDDEDLDTLVVQSSVKIDHLSAEVRERLMAEEKISRPLPVLKNCRPSPWSEPTPAIRVGEVRGEAYVATAEVPRDARAPVAGGEVRFSNSEGRLRAVAAIWDSVFGTRIPLVLDAVYPGSVLGGTGVTRVLDPIDGNYRKVENNDGSFVSGRAPGYKGSSGVVLVDFLGGKEIEGGTEARSKFKMPTEALVLDSSGQLMVRTAVTDARDFTWMSGEVLREDGVAKKLAEADGGDSGSTAGRSGRSGRDDGANQQGGSRGGRSGYPGGGNNRGPGGGGPGGAGGSGQSGQSGRSGRPG